jgi:hypothetical protein
VVLNVYEYVVLLGCLEKLLVMLQQLHGWLCDKDVDAAFDSVQSYRVVGGVWSEDCDYLWISKVKEGVQLLLTRTAFWERVDRGLVRVWVGSAFFWKLVERYIHAIVCVGDVLL